MRAARVLKALGPIDALSVVRDPLLRWMLAMPVLFGLTVRWGLPPLGRWLELRFQVSIAEYYPLLGSFLSVTAPTIYGAVIGFLLLEQRDDGTLTALQVTPLTARGYAMWRIAGPMLGSVVGGLVTLRLAGIPGPGFAGQLLAAVAAAPLAPAWALFLPAFAANKVQGFALIKAAGVLNWPPLIAWFVPMGTRRLFGLCPTYWPVEVYWELAAGRSALLPLVVGSLYIGATVFLLLRRFERVSRG
jgi:fluoroquinolone transport system permease protein